MAEFVPPVPCIPGFGPFFFGFLPLGGSVIKRSAFSYDELFVITFSFFYTMTAKLCKELQILFGNNMKYSDFTDDEYFLRNERLKEPHFSKKIASSKEFRRYFLLKFLVSVFIHIINMAEKFQKNRFSRIP